ncbi:UNVERIFIED_CONTAM: hypothetical protein H355_015048 [Colinus virginianus]|nr:hypothetical protein H355_015048 [Colinus virginianus]
MAGAERLQRWLNEATDPGVVEEKWECIQQFCAQLNADADGSVFLPVPFLQVLETCVNNCGEKFHNEIAKFRFLNELIKVLFPEYYGTWSSEKVKSRVTEIMFSWTVWFPQEVKIRDAYQLLKKQGLVLSGTAEPIPFSLPGIVKEDPKLPEDKILPPPSPRLQNSIFDTDEEKSKLLARLLKSTHAEDLQAANRLIKSVIKEEQEKSAKVSRRVNTITEVSENVKRMDELLEDYKRRELPQSDRETLQGLFQRCEKLRPLLFRLASETVDDDEALAELLQANDRLVQALGRYRKTVGSAEGDGEGCSASSSSEAPGKEPCSAPCQLCLLHFMVLQCVPVATCALLLSVCLSLTLSKAHRTPPRRIKSYTLIDFSMLEATSHTPIDQFSDTASASRHSSTTSTCLLEEELKSLDLSDPLVLQNPPPDFGLSEVSDPQVGDLSPMKLPLPDLPNSSMADPSFSSVGNELKPAASLHPASNDASLANLFVPLISITLSSIYPLTVYDRDGFKAMLHFSRDPAPGRPDVLVMVLSMLSTSAQPIKNIVFQAAVPKTMKIKLQPASSSELPAFSPLHPPAVVSQVLLLANPHKDPVRLKYELSFRHGVQPVTEVGELTGFPAAELWGS